MEILGREIIFSGKFLRLVRKKFRADDGKVSDWETVERTNVYRSGAVIVVAITRDNQMIFERNWRAPVESWVIQFPAGLTDVTGESETETARRELLEETGYLAGELIPLMTVPLTPDLTPTYGAHFLARDVEYAGCTRPEPGIEVIRVPLAKVKSFLLDPPDNTGIDLRVPGILWYLEKQGLLE